MYPQSQLECAVGRPHGKPIAPGSHDRRGLHTLGGLLTLDPSCGNDPDLLVELLDLGFESVKGAGCKRCRIGGRGGGSRAVGGR